MDIITKNKCGVWRSNNSLVVALGRSVMVLKFDDRKHVCIWVVRKRILVNSRKVDEKGGKVKLVEY